MEAGQPAKNAAKVELWTASLPISLWNTGQPAHFTLEYWPACPFHFQNTGQPANNPYRNMEPEAKRTRTDDGEGSKVTPSFSTQSNPYGDDHVCSVETRESCDKRVARGTWVSYSGKETKRVHLDGVDGFYFEIKARADYHWPSNEKGVEHHGYGYSPRNQGLGCYHPDYLHKSLHFCGPPTSETWKPVLAAAAELGAFHLSGGKAIPDVAELWKASPSSLFDVAVVPADGPPMACDRVLIAAASAYFKTALTTQVGGGEGPIRTVELPAISAVTLRAVLDWVYTGQCSLPDGGAALLKLKAAADFLIMEKLKEKLEPLYNKLVADARTHDLCPWLTKVDFAKWNYTVQTEDTWMEDASGGGFFSRYMEVIEEEDGSVECYAGPLTEMMRKHGEETETDLMSAIVNSIMATFDQSGDQSGAGETESELSTQLTAAIEPMKLERTDLLKQWLRQALSVFGVMHPTFDWVDADIEQFCEWAEGNIEIQSHNAGDKNDDDSD